MRIILLMLFAAVMTYNAFPQGRVTVGTVKDSASGRNLPLVNIFIPQNKFETVSDMSGSFVLDNLPVDSVSVVFSRIGYKARTIKFSAASDSVLHLNILLTTSPVSMGEVPVFSTKNISLLVNQPMPVDLVTSRQINAGNFVSVPDILQHEPGLALGRDGIWGTRISIRGLSNNSIIRLVDGNRIETATDIAAGLSLIDVNDIERIEVIKGSSGSIYGTGALGGVVNIITKTGSYNSIFTIGGTVSAGFATVNSCSSENLSLQAGADKWYARFNTSLNTAGNTLTPRGSLPNSQFTDNNISFSGGLKPFKNQELSIKYQNYYAKDVGIPGGNLLFPADAVVFYPNEQRQMFSAEYKIKSISGFIPEISAKYFYQVISRNVNNLPSITKYVATPADQPDKIMRVNLIHPHAMHYTNGIQLESGFIWGNNNYLTFGLDAWQRILDSRRERFITVENVDKTTQNVLSTVSQIIGERPLPESRFQSLGFYVQDEYTLINSKLKLLLGGRFDGISISNKQLNNPIYIITNGVTENNPSSAQLQWESETIRNSSWSGNAGLLYTVTKGFNLVLSLAKSFRSPSLEERYQFIDLGNLVELGNPDLKPEKGYFADLGAKIWRDNLLFNFDVFSNNITGLVVQKNGVYESRPALINTNVGNAVLYGFETGFEYNFAGSFVLLGSVSYVRGMDTEENQNLPQIPPFNGRIGIRAQIPGWLNINMYSTFFASQNKIAEGEIATPGYAFYDLYINTKSISTGYFYVRISGGIENIFNKAYRDHLSTNRGSITVEPGRNFFLKTIINF